jgi:hypothetical protein
METYQWFLLGLTVGWTPSLVVLTLLLLRRPIENNTNPPFLPHTESPPTAETSEHMGNCQDEPVSQQDGPRDRRDQTHA